MLTVWTFKSEWKVWFETESSTYMAMSVITLKYIGWTVCILYIMLDSFRAHLNWTP